MHVGFDVFWLEVKRVPMRLAHCYFGRFYEMDLLLRARLNADRADRLLVSTLHGLEREVLIDFQALFALMAGDQLDLRIRQPP